MKYTCRMFIKGHERPRCDVCNNVVDRIVVISPPLYPMNICPDCLRKALKLIEEEKP